MSEIRFVPPSAMQPPDPWGPNRTPGAHHDCGDWARWVTFGGIMMVLLGTFQATMGLVALLDEEYFLAARDDLPAGDYTTWGWTHLTLGTVAVVTGVGLLARWPWAHPVAIVVAGLSALANVGFVLAYPAWCVTVVVLDVIVVYTLTVHGAELRDRADEEAATRV